MDILNTEETLSQIEDPVGTESPKPIEYMMYESDIFEVDCKKSLTRLDNSEYINWLVWDDKVSPYQWKFSLQKLRSIFREITSDKSVERKSVEFFGHTGKTKVEIVYSNPKDDFPYIQIKDFRSKEHLKELELHYYQTVYQDICFQWSLLS